MNWMDIRIGQGYDVHALVEGRKLILGGVDIPHTRGLLGLFEFALLLATVTVLVPYAFTAAGQIVLIRRDPACWGGPDARRAVVTSAFGVMFAGVAIASAGWTAVLWGTVSMALGIPLYVWSVRTGRARAIPGGGA